MGMKLLELLNGCKVSIERPRVGSTADAGKIRSLVVGPGIGNGAGRRGGGGDIGEGVDEVRQLVGDAILLQVGDVVAGVVDTPLLEVSAQNLALLAILGK